MNEQESVLITRFPLAKIHTPIPKSALTKRQAILEKQLYDDLPIRQLRTCSLEYDVVSDHDGMWMLVFLTPSSQFSLPLSGSKQSDNDAFLEEVKWIRGEQKKLRESYEHALKSSTDPRNNPTLIARRRRLRKGQKEGQIWIPSRPEGERFDFPAPPRTMAHALNIRLRFEAIGIYKRDCRIFVREILTPEANPYLKSRPGRPRKVFRRDQSLGAEASREFSHSVDTGALLEAAGQIEFSWIDNSVGHISLTGLPILCGAGGGDPA